MRRRNGGTTLNHSTVRCYIRYTARFVQTGEDVSNISKSRLACGKPNAYIFVPTGRICSCRARVVTAGAMDHDDDVEHLFSWLQTPELRYREFAGAREITDAVVTWRARPNPADTPIAPRDNVQLAEEYPPDQFPDQRDAPTAMIEEVPVRAAQIPA